jgi:hypothetical protein
MQHALVWSSRRPGMFDEARGWVGSVSFILFLAYGSKGKISLATRKIFLGGILELILWRFFGVLCC